MSYMQDKEALSNKEKQLNNLITKFQELANNKENTTKLESDIKKEFDNWNELYQRIKTDNDNNTALPEREKGKRNAFLNNAKISFDRNKGKFDEIRKKKYGFDDSGKHDEYLSKYETDENMKNKSNEELLQYQQEKLKGQDKQIDDIISDVTKGKQMSKEIHGKLKDQNELLETIDENMDKLDSKMSRTKKKFETYLKKSSNCVLIVIMIVELLFLIFLIVKTIQK